MWVMLFILLGLFIFGFIIFLSIMWFDMYLWKLHKICWIHDWEDNHKENKCCRCGKIFNFDGEVEG